MWCVGIVRNVLGGCKVCVEGVRCVWRVLGMFGGCVEIVWGVTARRQGGVLAGYLKPY